MDIQVHPLLDELFILKGSKDMGLIYDLLKEKDSKKRMKKIEEIHNKQIKDECYGLSNYKIVFRDREVNKGGKKYGK